MEKRERGEHRGETNHGRKRRETGDGRRLKWKKKRSQGKGGDAAGEGRRAGSGRNVVGKTEWEETK